jgi:cytochrome b6-f complex iron-sulfur subunit
MNRRDFLSWFSLVGISSSLPFAIAACSQSGTKEQSVSSQPSQSPSPTLDVSPRSDGFTAVSDLPALKASPTGVIAPPEIAVALVANPSDPNIPLAVSPRCTHTACTVEWDKGIDAFICPCHGARFDATGKVLRGPADKPLQTYNVKVEGDTILVKIV